MNKYIAIFRVPVATMDEWKKNTPPEEIQTQMQKMGADMNAWMEKHAASFLDKGQPMGKTKTVSKSGVVDSRNDLNYYMIVEAESHDAAAAIFTDSPHTETIPDATVDVMEISLMGM